MRAALVVLTTLVLAGLIGVGAMVFGPASDDEPLQPITVEAPTTGQAVPADQRERVPDARTQLPPPPPVVNQVGDDLPPPPPAVVDDDFDDDDDSEDDDSGDVEDDD